MPKGVSQTNTALIDQDLQSRLDNQVFLEGTLARSCQVSHTPSGLSVTTLELEHSSNFPDTGPIKRLELQIPVVMFDTLAEQCAELPAGTRIRVIGRLNQKRWIRDNRIRWGQVEIIATTVEILPSQQKHTLPENHSPIPGQPDP